MDILLINHYAGSSTHGMEYRPFYLAREWTRLGNRVRIVAASYSHVRTQPPRVQGNPTHEEIDGISYTWLRTPAYRGNGVGRARNMLTFVGQLLKHGTRLADDQRWDVVIASSTYPLDIFPAFRIAKKCAAKLIFEVHDLWPLSPIELGGMSPNHPFILLLQWAESFAYRNADHVVSMLPKAESYMRAHGMAEHKFAYLPNGIDVTEWQGHAGPIPPEHRATLSRLRQEGRFIVGYAGAHGLANALDVLLEAAHLLQTQSVAFMLVGHGPDKEVLQQRARRLRLAHTFFLPPVPKPAIPTLLSSMDALFIGLKRKPIFRFGISPNKLMDYMMAAKPVVQAIDAGNDLVAESGCGLSVPPEDPTAIAQAVSQLMRLTPDQREAMGRRGKQYILTNHNYRTLAQRFLALMQG
jgi:glycosyltransferase involved in cell wall biosynthesis